MVFLTPLSPTSALPQSIAQKYKQLRAEFLAKYPHLSTLSGSEQRRLWREYLGIPIPLHPKLSNEYEEADCPYCGDSGRVIDAQTPKDSPDYGKAMPCLQCRDPNWEQTRLQRLKAAGGIPPAKADSTFEGFTPEPGSNDALNAAWMLAKGDADFKLLLIYGGVGNGKTHLAYAATNLAIERGLTAHCYYLPQLFSEWRRAMAETGEADAFLQRVQGLDFLALDDLGVEQGTLAQQSVLEQIVNYRYAQELPLLATTNRSPSILSIAMLSRFRDKRIGCMIFNSAPDYRVKGKPPGD